MKINLMVIENIDEMNKACAESYKKIMESAPVLEEMIKLTPDKVATMPQDSVDYYFNSLPHPLFEVNNFARNLINSNFDIIRNSENYYFLLMVNHYYSFYDAMTEFYENYGPIKLNNDINEVLLEKGIQSGTMDNSSRWNLMEMAKSDRIKYYIRTYLDLFVPNLKNYMVYMSDISQKIFKLTDYEELKKIYENSSSDNNYED
ncbi:MAG: hypothetical protein J1E82_04675 [Muribaculaceae bacterium]|nr:hypothetical protein [Muribaculaceae bacterium]